MRRRISFKDLDGYEEKGVEKHFKPGNASLLRKCHDKLAALPVFDLATTEQAYHEIADEMGISFERSFIRRVLP